MICEVRPCAKLACIFDADFMAVGHVSGIFHLGRVMHEVITFTVLGQRLLDPCAVCRESEVSVERWMLSF